MDGHRFIPDFEPRSSLDGGHIQGIIPSNPLLSGAPSATARGQLGSKRSLRRDLDLLRTRYLTGIDELL